MHFQCREYLTATNGNLEAAAQAAFADLEEDDAQPGSSAAASSEPAPANYTGPRTLDGRPAPQAGSSRSAAKKPQKKTGLATLSSLANSSAQDDADDSEEDEDDDPRGPRDTYAGGEKSGLAVQDPNQRSDPKQLINDILAKARR